MIHKFYLETACLAALAAGAVSCVDTGDLESRIDGLEDRVETLEETVRQVNENAITAHTLFTGGMIIMDVKAYSKTADTGGEEEALIYQIDFSDGSSFNIYIAEDGGGITPMIGVDGNGNWIYSIDGGTEWSTVEGASSATPQVRVNSGGVWEISTDNGTTWDEITDADGNKVAANTTVFSDSFFTKVEEDEDGNLVLGLATGQEITIPVYQELQMTVDENYTEGMNIMTGQTLTFNVEFSEDVAEAIVRTCPEGWRVQITEEGKFMVTGPASGIQEGDYTVEIWLQSAEPEKYIRKHKFSFHYVPGTSLYPDGTQAWQEFMAEDPDNVLLDFSYAGYNHGETAPPEVTVTENNGTYTASNGYTVYCITDYGAVPDDGKSDREAFIAMLTDALGSPEPDSPEDQMLFPHSNAARNMVFYFPEGNFILHTSADDTENGKSVSVIIRGSNIILKGAGRDKTTLTMADPNQPSQGEKVKYSSPDMIQLKHNTGIQTNNVLATVTGDSPKGAFNVTVGGTGSLKAGDWVCLYMKNTDQAVVAEELSPYSAESGWVIAGSEGVTVKDLHQVRSVSGNTVTFYEPVMHEVKAAYGWTIVRYQHYENVGVEDMTFAGNAKEDFDHHETWQDDGAYKPISITRVTDSWMRRVRFTSVSEASSIIESANVSVYDVEINGQRGHAAIRSQGSSRVFIGAVTDVAHGRRMDVMGHNIEGTDNNEVTGQYHAVGVSKESMGAVLWRNTWGTDGCFEAHASQPRATLIDCCSGSFRRWRQGGDANQMPNHLADLTIWNFNNTTPFTELSEWKWWDTGLQWWKFMPPVIVGFSGEAVTFDETQMKRLEGNGTSVTPESLYEAQLERRLGYVPAWLMALK